MRNKNEGKLKSMYVVQKMCEEQVIERIKRDGGNGVDEGRA